MICKVDMEKVYDDVNWGYVDWVLDQIGFGIKWRNWMKICISSPSFFVMINGSPKGVFKDNCSLHQCDLLSLCLFIIVTNLLGRMVAKAEVLGLIQGFQFLGEACDSFI